MCWESAVAEVEFQGKVLRSITLSPIVMNYVGDGQPDVHDALTNNEFLDTRGLPSPINGARATYILERLAELSKPFGTQFEMQGNTTQIKFTAHGTVHSERITAVGGSGS